LKVTFSIFTIVYWKKINEQSLTNVKLRNITKKKIPNFPDLINEFVKGTLAEGYGDVPKICIQALGRHANRLRYFHYHLGRNSQMIWSFGRRNAGDFIKYVMESKNGADDFYRRFYLTEEFLSKTVLESMKQVKVRHSDGTMNSFAIFQKITKITFTQIQFRNQRLKTCLTCTIGKRFGAKKIPLEKK
jgi:hypothetical protein